MLPKGANGVVMVEYSEQFDENTIAVYRPVSPGENMVARGDDLQQGEKILAKGTRITAQPYCHAGSLRCGAGARVYCPVRFAVISTGDEIVAGGHALQLGQIVISTDRDCLL